MVNMPRLVRGDLGGFTIKESDARATSPLSSKSSRRAVLAGVFSWFNGAFDKLYPGKRVVENQYFWRSIARS
jgi:hypothetical protein